MPAITLESLHNYLKLVENPSELKRRFSSAASYSIRSVSS